MIGFLASKPSTLLGLVWITELKRHGFNLDGLLVMEEDEIISITFGTLAMSMVVEMVFGCTATMDYLPSQATLLEEYFASVGELGWELRNLALPHLQIQYPNNPVPPRGTLELLSKQCQEIVSGLTSNSCGSLLGSVHYFLIDSMATS